MQQSHHHMLCYAMLCLFTDLLNIDQTTCTTVTNIGNWFYSLTIFWCNSRAIICFVLIDLVFLYKIVNGKKLRVKEAFHLSRRQKTWKKLKKMILTSKWFAHPLLVKIHNTWNNVKSERGVSLILKLKLSQWKNATVFCSVFLLDFAQHSYEQALLTHPSMYP